MSYIDVAAHSIGVCCGDERAHRRSRNIGGARLEGRQPGGDRLHQLRANPPMGEHPRRGAAGPALAGIEVHTTNDRLGGELDRRVGQDQDRVLATKLEADLLDPRLGGALLDLAPRSDAAVLSD